jgi:hypothetical protein
MINAIYAYNPGSQSARLLAEALGVRVLRHRGSTFRHGPRKTVINWGATTCPLGSNIINGNARVNTARCKLRTFNAIHEACRVPEFTTDRRIALEWLQAGDVCSRATTTGHEGIGLTVHPRGSNDLPNCPLYTKYVKKREEYRVHVIGNTIYTQRKLRRRGAEGDRQIRNTANGYVFSGRHEAPGDVTGQAIAAIQALGLDFGAVDVVWNEHHQQAYVLEVNTAPGIEGNTVQVYANALRNIIDGQGVRG